MTVRTRMAPSPTGEFHIGSMRGVLFNYAFSKKNGGQFVIRVEDTDRQRYVAGAEERMLDVITDFGLGWDEGPRVGGDYGPYTQSQRLDIYKKYALELVEKDKAYYCFCTSERLDELRKEQQAKGMPVTKYDRHCLNLTHDEIQKRLDAGEKYVIRLKVPDNEEVGFHDLVLGDIKFNTNDIDDQVLLKADGFPTYHLGVVVDDNLMKINYIMRGREWLPSTPKHVLLYKAFGWELPNYVHLPLLKEVESTKKMSKRTGDVAAVNFIKEGYLPEALVNFLMFLGWNPGTEKEIYTFEEFTRDFSIEKIQTSEFASFDRVKLRWFNEHYIRAMDTKTLLERIRAWAKKFEHQVLLVEMDETKALAILEIIKERLGKLDELNDSTSYFVQKPAIAESDVWEFAESKDAGKKIVKEFVELYEALDEAAWQKTVLDEKSHALLAEKSYKPKEAFMTLRLALTGQKATPPLFDIMEILGKQESLSRMKSLV